MYGNQQNSINSVARLLISRYSYIILLIGAWRLSWPQVTSSRCVKTDTFPTSIGHVSEGWRDPRENNGRAPLIWPDFWISVGSNVGKSECENPTQILHNYVTNPLTTRLPRALWIPVRWNCLGRFIIEFPGNTSRRPISCLCHPWLNGHKFEEMKHS